MDPRAVVSAYAQALNDGNAPVLLSLFATDGRVYGTPDDINRLTGTLSEDLGTQEKRQAFYGEALARRPLARTVVLGMVTAGDLVVAKLKFIESDSSPPEYGLAIYRVRDGLIQGLWHIARARTDDAAAARSSENVIERLGAANNRGDVEAFLALFSPRAKNFRNTGDPHALGDKPSVRVVDEKTRREAYVQMFANGAPAQVQTLGTVALNDMIVVREVAALPTGKVVDQLSVYRIENESIVHDWFIFNETR
jgi:hypothetical protein